MKRDPSKKYLNRAEDILSAWISMEAMCHMGFDKPDDLKVKANSTLDKITHTCPWERGDTPRIKGKVIFYEVILGSLNLKKSIMDLVKVYKDTRDEQPYVKKNAVLCSIILTEQGCATDGITISSFAWALGHILYKKESLTELKNWPVEEANLNAKLHSLLVKYDDEGYSLPLNKKDLDKAYEHLIGSLSFPEDNPYSSAPMYVIKHVVDEKAPRCDPSLLNSFYMPELSHALKLAKGKRLPKNVQRYIQSSPSKDRVNLFKNPEQVSHILQPKNFPLAAWPSGHNRNLVALQQFAVNCSSKLKEDEFLSINGPPGTGKTTLVRDIIANEITNRALTMLTFDDPEKAFKKISKQGKHGNYGYIYSLDSGLKGHEILVASSNNKAVENISKELPYLDSINTEDDLKYFDVISDHLYGENTWGMISAVLGNNFNKNKFIRRFWQDKDTGLKPYLLYVAGRKPDKIKDITVTPPYLS